MEGPEAPLVLKLPLASADAQAALALFAYKAESGEQNDIDVSAILDEQTSPIVLAAGEAWTRGETDSLAERFRKYADEHLGKTIDIRNQKELEAVFRDIQKGSTGTAH